MTTSPPRRALARAKGQNPRARLIVLVLPYLWSVFAIAGVSRINGSLAGIPVLLWWVMAGVVVTFGSLAAVWHVDERRHISSDRQAGAGCSGS